MQKNKIIFLFMFIVLLVGISCVSAENIDNVSDLSTDDSVDVISVDENYVLADSATSTTVYNWTELGSAVSKDSNVETVYLGANIIPGEQIKIAHNVTIVGSADTYIGGDNSTDPVIYSAIPIYSNENGLSITLKNIRFQNSGGNILMQFSGNGTYVLDNCSFVNVNATGSHQAVVYLNLGYMDILNCTFENCTTSYGAVSNYNERSVNNVHMTVRDTTFKKNHATTEPGAINNCGQLEVYDTTFEENSAAWWAGAIHTHYNANTLIVRSKFEKNAAKSSYNGGALYTYGTLTIIDSNFTGNRAPNGGAIAGMNYMSRASITLRNCEFRNNTAGSVGGAIMFPGAEFIAEDSRFYDNVAGSSGGALSVSASVANITNCEFKSNSAHNAQNNSKGGALNFATTNGNLIGSTFEDCSSDNGGSVYWANDDGVMSDCSFVNSHADNNGGAVYWAGDNGVVEKSSFDGCSADNYGGGIYFEGTDCILADSTFKDNVALEGQNWYSVEPLNPILAKTVYTWDELGSAVQDDTIGIIYLGSNLIPGEQIKIAHNVTIVGSADTYIGGDNSTDPVIYSAIPIYSNENGLSITLKNIRFQNSGGNILMQFSGNGTYVLDNCSFVNVNATGSHQAVVYLNLGYMDILSCTFENCTTSYGAVSNYNERSVNNVHMTVRDTTFKKNHATTEPGAINNCGQLEVYDTTFEENTAAWWAGAIHTHYNANTLIVRSKFENNAAKSSYNGGALYTYSAVTVIDSNFTGNRAPNGGAISGMNYMSRASLTLRNCEFRNNTAGSVGGAIMFSGAAFIAEDSRFYDNVAGSNGGALSVSASVANITNCEFKSNSAHNAQNSSKGGALNFVTTEGNLIGSTFEDCSSDNGGSVYWANDDGVMSDCIFVNSHADNNGGAVYWAGDNGVIEKSTFDGCSADNYGGGIYFEGTNCTLADSTFKGNDALEGQSWYSVEPLDVINVTIIQIPTVLNAPDVKTSYKGNDSFTATLKDINGEEIAGAQVKILLNNVEYTLETDSEGQVSLSIPSTLTPKTYVVTVTYDGDDIYSSAAATANIVVTKAETIISAPDVNVAYKDPNGEVVATIVNEHGKTLVVNLNVELNGETYTVRTDSNGQASIPIGNLTPGKYNATIRYKGSGNYKGSTATALVTVTKAGTVISAPDVNVAYKDPNAVVVATVTNEHGKTLVVNLNVELNGETYKVKTDSNGQATIPIGNLTPGKYNATITYKGSGNYKGSTATALVTVTKAGTIISTQDVNIAYRDPNGELVATVTNEHGKTLVVNLNIELNGKTYTVRTDSNGQARLSLATLTPGTYTATIKYKGSGNYKGSTATALVTVTKAGTAISAPNVNIAYRDPNGELVATVTNEHGKPLVVNLKIGLNGKTYTVRTDSNGQANISLGTLTPGNYTATISYKGSSNYEAATTTAQVVVTKSDTVISAPDVTVAYRDLNGKLVSTITNEHGKPLVVNLNVELNGKTYTATTDSNGQISVPTADLDPGTYTATISYKGSSNYNPTSTTANIVVKPKK